MIDLKNSGLDIVFDEKAMKLISKTKKIKLPKPAVRTLRQARKFLMNPKSNAADNSQKLYLMYRDVHFREDKQKLNACSLRYDITIIMPNKLGEEFVKTVGHYHPYVKNEKTTYPEVYEVLHGIAHYLLQKMDSKGNIEDAKLVVAEKNEKVLIPPGYGHVTINSGKEPLVMSNLVERNFSSEYGDYKKKHGAAYYGIEINGQLRFVQNEKYRNHPKLKIIKVKESPQYGLVKSMPLYISFVKFPNKFCWLVKPQDYFQGC